MENCIIGKAIVLRFFLLLFSFFLVSILVFGGWRRCMRHYCLLLVSDDVLNFKFFPLYPTLCAQLGVALIILLILRCDFALLMLLAHLELYEAVLTLIFVRVAWRRPPEITIKS